MERSPWEPEGVECLLDANGEPATAQAREGLVGLDLCDLWASCQAARELDHAMGALDLPGWVPAAGEEAPLLAAAALAGPEDWIYPSHRDLTLAWARGVTVEEIVGHVLGDPQGEALGRIAGWVPPAADRGIAATSHQLGLHLALASGQAHGQKLARTGQATLALFGEGTTTTGVFHETLAVAASADLPLILVCKSQIWADQAPCEAGLLGDSVAERARACGIWTRRVDGADAVAVWRAIEKAFVRAREGAGPSLIDVVVTRLGGQGLPAVPDHRDPLHRLGLYLQKQGYDVAVLKSQACRVIREAWQRVQPPIAGAHQEARS